MPQLLTNEQLLRNLEIILDKVAQAMLININKYSSDPITTLRYNQKTISRGIVTTLTSGLTTNDVLVLYQKEVRANPKDVMSYEDSFDENQNIVGLTALVDSWGDVDVNNVGVQIQEDPFLVQLINIPSGQGPLVITNMVIDQETGNPPNLSQFVNFQKKQQNIDPQKGKEYLNTDIYELLPTQRSRQKRIDNFFAEYQALKGFPPVWDVDGVTQDLIVPSDYSGSHDISAAQDNAGVEGIINEQNAFITRLNINANQNNTAKTLQYLRNDLNRFLEDIDQDLGVGIEDERPEYENKSEGYLKIRHLNQGIIVRKQEGDDIGLEELVSIDSGYNHIINTGYVHPHADSSGPSYLMDGFTITEWVRFLDKTSTGTLFNYGNPTRSLDPRGFKLETFMLHKDNILVTDSSKTWGEVAEEKGLDTFIDSDSARFIRLVVYDHKKDLNHDSLRKLYDSRLGITGLPRNDSSVPELGYTGNNNWTKGDETNLLGHTQIPIDFNEWFFIVASYNPLVEDQIYNGYEENEYYWRGNLNPEDNTYIYNSGYGTKCKVEVISKSDLLRARGYKV